MLWILGMPKPAVMPCRTRAATNACAPVIWLKWDVVGEATDIGALKIRDGRWLKIKRRRRCASVVLVKELEADANTKLQLAHRESRGKSQRCTSRTRSTARNIKRGEAWLPTFSDGKTEIRTHYVVYTGKVRAVRQVKAFSQHLKTRAVAHFETARDAHVEIHVVRTQAGIPRRANRTIIGAVAIAIHVGTSQKVERMPAVVAENRRELEAGENTSA